MKSPMEEVTIKWHEKLILWFYPLATITKDNDYSYYWKVRKDKLYLVKVKLESKER